VLELLSLIFTLSVNQNVDPYLVAAIAKHESQLNTNAVGAHGEIGLMQLRPQYFAEPGEEYRLFEPDVNIRLGIRYLKKARSACRHKEGYSFLVCYNSGVTGGNRIVHANRSKYVADVLLEYNTLKKSPALAAYVSRLLAPKLIDLNMKIPDFRSPGSMIALSNTKNSPKPTPLVALLPRSRRKKPRSVPRET
jgi:soluble lytic murein transglycosylase-like protein